MGTTYFDVNPPKWEEGDEPVFFDVKTQNPNAPSFFIEPRKEEVGDEFLFDAPTEPTDVPKRTPPPVVSADPDSQVSPFDKYKQGEITKDVALADKDIMALMRDGLELRFGSRGRVRGAATYALGGSTGSFQEDMSDEEVYEMWQNWQRSFAGGQTVTTANEVAFNSTLDDREKAILGAQYMMFDKHADIFDAKTSWGEMFDGMGDYARAAIWDPTTVLSFGVGKVLGVAGGKAASQSLRQVAIAAYRESLKKGMSKTAAKQAGHQAQVNVFKQAGKQAVGYAGVDFVSNITADVLYQNQLIDTGAQEEYSATQTAVAGLATIMLPAVVEGSRGFARWINSGKAPESMKAAVNISKEFGNLSKAEMDEKMKVRVDWESVQGDFADAIANFAENKDTYTRWSESKAEASEAISSVKLEEGEMLFIRSFLFGDTEAKTKGFVQSMSDAGLVYVPRSDDDNITNFLGDAISWLDDEMVEGLVKDYVDNFQRTFGEVESLKDIKSAYDLKVFWEKRQAVTGSRLWDSKHTKDILGKGVDDFTTNQSLMDTLMGSTKKKGDKESNRSGYILSLYKSALTSHPGTTGLNIKGFVGTSAANTVSDLVQGVLEIGVAGTKAATGQDYAEALQKGKGSITGALRRGVYFLAPEDTVEKAMEYMKYRPEILEELSKDLGGDSGAKAGVDTLKQFGLDPNAKVNLGAEATRNALQTVAGVKLQDEVTKMLGFMSNMDLLIRREYGKTFNEFMTDPNLGMFEMHSPRFRKKVEANALERTLRETYSKEWTSKVEKGSNVGLSVAKGVEAISRNSLGGYIIPFGKFFNTSMAMMGDYSGINSVRHLAKKIHGKEVDLATEEGTQLLAKSIVGITAAYYMSEEKLKNIAEGLRWNQERESDGSIKDVTYDFPESMLHLVGQIVAHWRRDGEVPDALAGEALELSLTQTFRTADDTLKTMYGAGLSLFKGNVTEGFGQVVDAGLGTVARIASGGTRFMDPINQTVKFVEGDFSEPDRNVSGDRWTDKQFTKKATRYFDEFFELMGAGAEESPRAVAPTAPDGPTPSMGRVMGGARTTAGNSRSEQVLASVGRPSWNAFNWGNDPDLKNFMNGHVARIFEEETAVMLSKYPDFFDKSLAYRERRVELLIKKAKERTKDVMNVLGGDMPLIERLANANKKDLRRAMEHFQIEGDPKDLLDEEGGDYQLQLLLDFAENMDDYILVE